MDDLEESLPELTSDENTTEFDIEFDEENPNVGVVEIGGRKYNEVFDPLTQTTHLEPLLE